MDSLCVLILSFFVCFLWCGFDARLQFTAVIVHWFNHPLLGLTLCLLAALPTRPLIAGNSMCIIPPP